MYKHTYIIMPFKKNFILHHKTLDFYNISFGNICC